MDSIQVLSAFFATFAQLCGMFAVWTVAAFIAAARREAAICAGLSLATGSALALAHLERWTQAGVDLSPLDLTPVAVPVTVSYETRIARDNRPYIVALAQGRRAEIVGWFARGEINTAIEMCEILNG